jgi:APA family basic amino acid/polyamine antiporter
MLSLPWSTWWRLILWMALGVLLYFSYGHRHTRTKNSEGRTLNWNAERGTLKSNAER